LEGRVRAVQGDAKLTDEISAIFLPGHTPGSQGLRVETAGRPVVLAADAVHYYEELRLDMPFLYADNLAAMYQSFDRLRGLEAAGDVLVPGHASEVTTRFASRTLGGGCEYVRLL
jgi:glyoxylase-like metal-dependent hydrolase (beta-lactamase superfamily II)